MRLSKCVALGVGVFLLALQYSTVSEASCAFGQTCPPVNNSMGEGEEMDPQQDQCGESAEGSDPVSVINGELYLADLDLEVKGIFPIRMVRRYSSQSEYVTPLGYGWTFGYDMALYKYPDSQETVVVRSGCGVKNTYSKSGAAYSTPVGTAADLVENGDGTYTLVWPGGRRANFDTDGRLGSLEDPQANRLVFSYDPGGKLDVYGTSRFSEDPSSPRVLARSYRWTTIEEELADGTKTGRSVTADYDPLNGRLRSISSNDGRTVSYVHELHPGAGVSTGNLTTVEGLEGINSTYVYADTDPHNLTEITHAQGEEPWVMTYDGEDRVDTQTRGLRLLDFDYPTATKSVVTRKVRDAQGQDIHDVITEYTYDSDGLLTEIKDALQQTRRITRVPVGSGAPEQVGRIDLIELITNDGGQETVHRTVDLEYHPNGDLMTRSVTLDSGETVTESWTWEQGWVASYGVSSDLPGTNTFLTTYTFCRNGACPGVAGERITNIHQVTRVNSTGADEVTTFEYTADSRQVSMVTLPDAHRVVTQYYPSSDPANRAALPSGSHHLKADDSIHDHLRVSWNYDPQGNLAEITDARGVLTAGTPNDYQTLLAWDDRGRLKKVTNALSEEAHLTWSAPTYQPPPAAPGAPTVPGRYLTEIERGAVGATRGQRRRLHHDDAGRIRVVQRFDGASWQDFTTLDWSSDDQILKQTTGRGGTAPSDVVEFSYDLLGRLEMLSELIEAPDRKTLTHFTYDIAGNEKETTRAYSTAEAATTQFAFDDLNRVTMVTQKDVSPGVDLTTRFEYDALRNVTAVVDPKMQRTDYEFDSLGRLRRVLQDLDSTLPLPGPDPTLADGVKYDWDDGGRLYRVYNQRGQVVEHSYTDWGGLIGTKYFPDKTAADADNPDRVIEYSHNLLGKTTSVADDSLQTGEAAVNELLEDRLYDIDYDPLNRIDLVNVHYVPGNDIQLDPSYDEFGNRSSLNITDDSVGYAYAWNFNDLNRLTQATFPGSGATVPGAAVNLSFQYFENDDLERVTHSNATETGYSYHANGTVDTITVRDAVQTQLHHLDYEIDALLNVIGVDEVVGTTALSPSWSYQYDGGSRLGAATYPVVAGLTDPLPTGQQLFPSDGAGNRDDNLAPGTSPWIYNENNEISESPQSKYVVDADGNVCKWAPASGPITAGCSRSADETAFLYDHTNRLERIDRPDGSTVTYLYDPLGRRLSKSVGGTTTWFVWDGDRLLAEYDSSGDRLARYAYTQTFAPNLMAIPNGTGGEDVYEIHADHLTAPRLATDSSGSPSWRMYPEAFGAAHIDSPSGLTVNLRLPGQYYDAESERWDGAAFVPGSGLHFNRWRYYQPETGRYTRADPIGQFALIGSQTLGFGAEADRWTLGGGNPFLYVDGNPVGLIDPSGLLLGRAMGRAVSRNAADAGAAGQAADVALGGAVSVGGALGEPTVGSAAEAAATALGICPPPGLGDALDAALAGKGAFSAYHLSHALALSGGLTNGLAGVALAGLGGFELGSALRNGIRLATGFDIGTGPADALADRLGL